MKGRKAIPTHLKILAGNPGKQKLPKGEPVHPPCDVPIPPDHLDATALEEWHRMVVGLHAMNILHETNKMSLAAYCDSYSQWRAATIELNKIKAVNPEGAIVIESPRGIVAHPIAVRADKTKADMMRYAAEIGMTPVSQSRLAIDKRQSKSKFDGLIAKK